MPSLHTGQEKIDTKLIYNEPGRLRRRVARVVITSVVWHVKGVAYKLMYALLHHCTVIVSFNRGLTIRSDSHNGSRKSTAVSIQKMVFKFDSRF